MTDLRLKCTKFNFGWGSAQTPLGSLQHSTDPLAGFNGPTSKGREGRAGNWRGKGNRREGNEREREKRRKRKGREGGRRREGAPIKMKAP